MANQRKAGVHRVTLTLPEELLRLAEIQARELGVDRLALIRDALAAYLGDAPAVKPTASSSSSGPLSAKASRRPRAKRPAPTAAPAKPEKAAKATPPAKAEKPAPAAPKARPGPAKRTRPGGRRA